MYEKLLIPHIFLEGIQVFYETITYQVFKKTVLAIELNA